MPKQKQIRLQPSPGYNQTSNDTPMLRISGQWLKEHGFNAGEYVNITVREGLLVIQPLKS